MKKLILLLLLCHSLHAIRANGTDNELFSLGPGFKQVYSVKADYFFGSDAITNRLASEYYRKGFISNEIKDDVSTNLFERNVFGAEYNYSITIGQNLDTIFGLLNGNSFIRLSNRAHIHSKFKEDLFEMYFRGNKKFAGQKADLGPFDFRSISYQQFTYGIERYFRKNNKMIVWSSSLSLNIGQKYLDYRSEAASLYTAPDGSFIDLDLHLRIRSSDSSHNKLGSFNGYGFSGSGSLIIKDEKQNAWIFSAENLGFISWAKESAYIPIDSTFRFEGIDVSDIFDFSDTLPKKITTDSAYKQAFLVDRSKKSFSAMLPFYIRGSYSAQIHPGKLILQIGVEHSFFAGAIPRGFSELKYNFKKRHQLALNLSYGGYTFWNFGIDYNGIIGKSWVLRTGTDYLGAMLNKNHGLSQGAFIGIEKYF